MTGWYHLRARQYDPATGRFTQADPIGYAGGGNLYAYAGNNPATLTDPLSGRQSNHGSARLIGLRVREMDALLRQVPPSTRKTHDYAGTFFKAHPELYGRVEIHHAILQAVLHKYPGRFTSAEIHALPNLRGIPLGRRGIVHDKLIPKQWTLFYRAYPYATREQIIANAVRIDGRYGGEFLPRR